MKTKELYQKLHDIMVKGGSESEVYFDTEAATFNVHCVEITSICYEPKAFGDINTPVTIHCDSSKYKHKENDKKRWEKWFSNL